MKMQCISIACNELSFHRAQTEDVHYGGGMFSATEFVVKQTKAMGRDTFVIESPSGEPLGTARQTRNLGDLVKASRGVEVFDAKGAHVLTIEDPINLIRDTYIVNLVSPPMQLAKLTKRFSWLGSRFNVEVAGFPNVDIEGRPFNLNYALTSQGQPFAEVNAEFSGVGRALVGKTSYRVRLQQRLNYRQTATVVGLALAIDMRRAKMRRRSG